MPALAKRRSLDAVLALTVLLWLCAFGVRAQESCSTDAGIAVQFMGDPWPVDLEHDAAEDLKAGLRLRGIEVCSVTWQPAVVGRQPAARIVLSLFAAEHMRVSIDVQDAVTSKRVLRDIELARVARDARALALAQAAEELLRASWVELTMHDAPPPAVPPPPAIKRAVTPPPAAAPERLQLLGARFASELYTGGIKLLGADAVVAFWVAERVGFSVQLGIRTGLRADADHGRIDVSALTASAAVIVPVWERSSRYNLIVGAGGHVAELTLSGHGPSGVRAQSQATFIASARLTLSVVWSITQAVRLDLSVGPGLPLRRAIALDSGRDVLSTRGAELHGALGLGGMF
jgi:hypothetical protein